MLQKQQIIDIFHLTFGFILNVENQEGQIKIAESTNEKNLNHDASLMTYISN